MEVAKNHRIEGTEIFVFSQNSDNGLYTYSRPFNVKEAEVLATGTNDAIKQYGDVSGLRQGLTSNSNGELVNMNTLKGIVANRVLMGRTENQQWLPTIKELIALQKNGMLPSGIFIDGGIALYDAQNPDSEIAQALMATVNQKGYATPVLASFRSLGLEKGGKRYGVIPVIVSPDGLITGEDAKKTLNEDFYLVGDSGARRLNRYSDGRFGANWNVGLDGFSENCRVGRFSAVGSAQKLEQEALGNYQSVRKSLDALFASGQ
jgi:hypothetical protein